MSVDLTNRIFHDEAAATAQMEADRWPDGVYCPLCGSTNVHRMGRHRSYAKIKSNIDATRSRVI